MLINSIVCFKYILCWILVIYFFFISMPYRFDIKLWRKTTFQKIFLHKLLTFIKFITVLRALMKRIFDSNIVRAHAAPPRDAFARAPKKPFTDKRNFYYTQSRRVWTKKPSQILNRKGEIERKKPLWYAKIQKTQSFWTLRYAAAVMMNLCVCVIILYPFFSNA